MRLVFALPCENQSEGWTAKQKLHYENLLGEADEIIYVSKTFTSDCMKNRNLYMIDNSAVCICAFLYEKSETGQTFRYAVEKGLKIINIAFTNPKNQSYP